MIQHTQSDQSNVRVRIVAVTPTIARKIAKQVRYQTRKAERQEAKTKAQG